MIIISLRERLNNFLTFSQPYLAGDPSFKQKGTEKKICILYLYLKIFKDGALSG